MAISVRRTAIEGSKLYEDVDWTRFIFLCNFKDSFQTIHYICLNMAMWCFSFRYWNIAHVMPLHLSGRKVSPCQQRSTIALFFTGLFINIIAPCLYLAYSVEINNAATEGVENLKQVYNAKMKGIKAGFFGIGAC